MTQGDLSETEEETGGVLLMAGLTVAVCVLLLLSATAFAIYGLVTGRTMSLPGRGGQGGFRWEARAADPGEFWFSEALWLFLGALGPALCGYVLWGVCRGRFRPAKGAAPPGEQDVTE